jgi:protein tyrosine phosphatase
VAGEWQTWEQATGQKVKEFQVKEEKNKYVWTWEDTALEGTLYILSWMDMAQTLQMSRRYDEGYYEMNPLLGKHPSRAKIIGANVVGLSLHTYIATQMPKPHRTIWQGFWIGVEGDCVNHNLKAGLKLHW